MPQKKIEAVLRAKQGLTQYWYNALNVEQSYTV